MKQKEHNQAQPFLKMPHINNGGGENGPLMEDLTLRRDSLNGEKQKDSDSRESDAVDGIVAAEINLNRRGSSEKKSIQGTTQRRTKQKVVSDFGTVSKGGNKFRRPVQALFSQGVSEKPSEQERAQLDLLKQNLEAFAVPLPPNLKWQWKEENYGTTLEKEWTDLVTSHTTMAKMQRNQQAALWEFLNTELSYINKLKIIKDLVIAALVSLHQHEFLQEVTPELLFSNLPSILQAHQLFWQDVLYPMLQEVRLTGEPFDPMRLEAGCLQFHERFSAYHDYCWKEENNLEFTRKQMESNPLFSAFVQWVEDHPQCERMRLGDMQAKPHQRITKYPLLLKSVLENTHEPQMQGALRGMLSSVNGFLESINQYMQLKDDENALSISAQRLEGYEVEGINEEIDKRVREICQFDLTCPIRGVSSEVIRKLLMEDSLKVRGRKESKLELVALLFTDVLLLTKVQKKGERLKVARPPLALDRTDCFALKEKKEDYSFVLVEVGDLMCPMNVIVLGASSSEKCASWVSTIQQAKETLANLREQNNKVESVKEIQQQATAVTDAKTEDVKTAEKPPAPPKTLMEELSDALKIQLNGLADVDPNQPSEDVSANNIKVPFRNSQRKNGSNTTLCRQQAFKEPEWIELARRDQVLKKSDKEDKTVETQVMMSKYRGRNASKPNYLTTSNPTDSLRLNLTRPPKLLDELPDVDYPTDEESTLQLHNKPPSSSDMSLKPPVDKRLLVRSNSALQLVNLETRRGSYTSQSGDRDASLDVSTFPQNLKSPGLRKRRTGGTNQSPANQVSKALSQDSGQAVSASNSSSDSECNSESNRNSLPAAFGSDLQRAPKVGPKPTHLNKYQGISIDVQSVSESEQPDETFQNTKPTFKNLRSSSSFTTINDGRLRGIPSKMHGTLQEEDPPRLGFNPTIPPSPVESLLERAKEWGKAGIKMDKNVQAASPTPSYQTHVTSYNPSPTPSDGDRDVEEREVGLTRRRALTVSMKWKEQLVDGDEDDKSSSTVSLCGENVDWPGWCFDDEEVLNHLNPKSPGFLEGMNRSLANWGHVESQDDGECSQV